MTVTKNIIKATAVAILVRRFWKGQNLITKFYAEESKKRVLRTHDKHYARCNS